MSESEYQFRPLGTWPRKPTVDRKRHPFKQTYSDTLRIMDYELWKLSALLPIVIEADFPEWAIRNDGRIRADAPRPNSPGVIISFRTKKFGPLKFICDDCVSWQDNIRAIALTLTRLREADIYGVTKRGEQYTGWRALPPPLLTPPRMTVEEAAGFIGNEGGGVPFRRVMESADTFRAAYRRAAAVLHPDANGQVHRPEWQMLQDAKAVLERHLEAS